MYVKASGDGYDLPYGCVFYRSKNLDGSNSSKYYIFWNPKGVTLSIDEDIQQICLDCNTDKDKE